MSVYEAKETLSTVIVATGIFLTIASFVFNSWLLLFLGAGAFSTLALLPDLPFENSVNTFRAMSKL